MAAVTVSTASAHNAGAQNLYTLVDDQFAKTVPTSVGSTATIEFDTSDVTTGSNVAIAANGEITLGEAQTYSLQARADVINGPAGNLQWYDVTNDADIGPAIPLGSGMTVLYDQVSVGDVVVTARAVTKDGSAWPYPAALVNATVAVQSVSGFGA